MSQGNHTKERPKINTDARQGKLIERRVKFRPVDILADLKADIAKGSRFFWRSRGMDEPVSISLATFGKVRRGEE